VIELPVKHPELFDALGIAQPKGKLPQFSISRRKKLVFVFEYSDVFANNM
jgi:hypothetical protein